MSLTLQIALPLLVCFVVFFVWYGGSGTPLTQLEIDQFMHDLARHATTTEKADMLDKVRQLVANDDGNEFVMQNLARYRTQALYPPGAPYNDDARAADRRYGRAILWPLLKHGCLPVFIARRIGHFIEPPGACDWHYVAMVRYRSRRDFLRFALMIEESGASTHKWAALEKTQVFPVRPLLSLIGVRLLVASLLASVGLLLLWALG